MKCDRVLEELRETNKNHLTILLSKCHIDYRQQIVKKKMEKVNNEVGIYFFLNCTCFI